MAVKIRLARHGKKNFAYFHIVVADSRSPRDGRFIEQIGVYNPNANPSLVELDGEKALDWMMKGAQPTDTCRRILSHHGVLLKKHLLEGVRKGALTEETANAKWEAWMQEKEAKVQSQKSTIAQEGRNVAKLRLEAEAKANEVKAAAVAKKKLDLAQKEAEAKASAQAEEAAEAQVQEQEEALPAVEETPAAAEAETEAAPAEA